jgi:hypothetical protein
LTACYLWKFPVDKTIELLPLSDPPLFEAIVPIISLVIERQCIDPNYMYVVEFNIPATIGPGLETIGGGTFRLKKATIRFIHVVSFDWHVLPDEAFWVYMNEFVGFMPSESPRNAFGSLSAY